MTAAKRQRTSARIASQTRNTAPSKNLANESDLDGNASSSSLSSIPSSPASPASPEKGNGRSSSNGKKRRKGASAASRPPTKVKGGAHQRVLFERLFAWNSAAGALPSSLPPRRAHCVAYHRPLLLDDKLGQPARKALLTWFDSVSETRGMPWRKPWVDPRAFGANGDGDGDGDRAALRAALKRRAYEVWISEIMLQQTRVAAVVGYWARWMARWPTIEDLAAARAEDVLAAWGGLGYYSRATRIHEAARAAVGDAGMRGLLPAGAGELEARMAGVGRYTAGAISSIVFGRAAAMVDGNVLRVLSRQLGIYGDVKRDRAVVDAIWAAAEAIVGATAALDGESVPDGMEGGGRGVLVSDRPGRWGQGLMELGSTVCTPKPNCAACPITGTCRAFMEGEAAAAAAGRGQRSGAGATSVVDIEDACTLCESFENSMDEGEDHEEEEERSRGRGAEGDKDGKAARQAALAAFAFTRQSARRQDGGDASEAAGKHEHDRKHEHKYDSKTMDAIVGHARRFPVKGVKKAVRAEETLVCAVRRRSDGRYLLVRRPLKGLLAGLWELPSRVLEASSASASGRKRRAELAGSFVSSLLGDGSGARCKPVADLGSVPWLFSHIRLTMHVYVFEVDDTKTGGMMTMTMDFEGLEARLARPSRWVGDADGESMGTGMRKCWALVKAQC